MLYVFEFHKLFQIPFFSNFTKLAVFVVFYLFVRGIHLQFTKTQFGLVLYFLVIFLSVSEPRVETHLGLIDFLAKKFHLNQF